MSQVGVRASRRGYNAETAADHQLLFDSDFFTPKILFADTVSDEHSHNLGFYPMWLTFNTEVGTGRKRMSASGRMGKDKITGLGAAEFLMIFDIDLEKDYNIPTIKSMEIDESKENQREDDFIFAISGQEDVFSETKTERFFTSELRYPIIHMLGHGNFVAGSGVRSFPHKLGYVPQFFFYYNNQTSFTDNCYQAIFGSALDFYVNSDEEKSEFNCGYNGRYSFLILKDPLGA